MQSVRSVAASLAILAAFAAAPRSAPAAAPFPPDTVLLDFQADWCGPCRSMESTVAQLAAAGYPIRKVDIDREPAIRRQYGVTAIPCFILVSGGRELARTTGPASASELQGMFAKAAAAALAAAPPRNAPPIVPVSAPAANPFSSAGLNRRADDASSGETQGGSSRGAAQDWGGAPTGATNGPLPTAQFLAASVRLSVEDATGVSHGSGTLVDARNGEALVLTCGHIFRDSQGKGAVWVDVFGRQPQAKLPGRVVVFDLDRDVALVSIRPTGPVTTLPIAPPGYKARVGDRVASVGCDHGADPTARESKVNAINKFTGPPNLEVAGQPVEGRSGGGLFSADGYVIGVCNAADPADNEGLYAAVATIHAQLDQANLAAIYRQRAGAVAPASFARADDSSRPGAGSSPTMPAKMPPSRILGGPGGPRSKNSPATASAGDLQSLSAQERATLAELQRKSQHAEVICIVRSLGDPQAKSEIIVLDRASPAFLRQLSAERTTQDARHLTSFETTRPAASSTAAAPPWLQRPAPAPQPAPGFQSSPAANSNPPGGAAAPNWQPNWGANR